MMKTLYIIIGNNQADLKRQRIAKLNTNQWNQLSNDAIKSGVGPLLYYHLKELKISEGIPEHILELLQNCYYQNLIRNMRIYNTLEKILKRFNEQEIPVIVLKGGYLAENVYSNIALRTMVDIDLLIHKEKYAEAEKIMAEFNYFPINNKEYWINNHFHVSFLCGLKPPIEIHWALSTSEKPFRLPVNEIWKISKMETVANNQVCTLDLYSQILYLCFHTSNHDLLCPPNKIKWLYDIKVLLEKNQGAINWDYLSDFAHKYSQFSRLEVVLIAVMCSLNVNVPLFKRLNRNQKSIARKYVRYIVTNPLMKLSTKDFYKKNNFLYRVLNTILSKKLICYLE
ncbi:MAG: nucleotidyltransferase family protein, partial [Calditrichaeota bacterium]|nr:nucleotidyltransferase family protein [Calditrichota bacterium]